MKWKILLIGLFVFNVHDKLIAQTIKFDDKGKIIGEIPNYIKSTTKTPASLTINLDAKMSTANQNAETGKIQAKYAGNVVKSDAYYTYANSSSFGSQIDLDISLNRVLNSTSLAGSSSNALSTTAFNKVLYKINNGTTPETDVNTPALNLTPFDAFKLKKINVKNVVIKGLYDGFITGYVPLTTTITNSDILKVKDEMQVLYDQIKDAHFNHSNDISDELLQKIISYNTGHSLIFANLRSHIQANATWLKNTAFINGVPSLNPLGFTDEGDISSMIAIREKSLKLKESEKAVLDGLYDKSKKIDMTTIDVAFEKYKNKKVEIESSIISLNDEISSLKKQLSINEKIKKSWANGASILNDVQLFPTKNSNKLIYMRHHDATNNMASMEDNVLPYDFKRYEQGETVKILLHNTEPGKYNSTFDTTITTITETALFTETVLPILNNFNTGFGSFTGDFSKAIAKNGLVANFLNSGGIKSASDLDKLDAGTKGLLQLDKVVNTSTVLSKISFPKDAVILKGALPTLQDKALFMQFNLDDIKTNSLQANTPEVTKSIIGNLSTLSLNNIGPEAGNVPFGFLDLILLNNAVVEILEAKQQEQNNTRINSFITDYAMVNWLSTQTAPLPFPDLEDAGPVYKTEVYEAKHNDRIPSNITYTVGRQNKTDEKDKSKASFNFKMYKKQYIQFTAMAAFFPVVRKNLNETNVNQRTVVSYDGSNNTFTTNNYKPYDVVFGAKIYPLGLNIRKWMPVNGMKKSKEYRSMLRKRGDLICNRFSIMVGLSVSQKQLRNYFFGVGYEIVPGCGINGGFNAYSTPYYKIEQNKLVSTKEHFKPAYFVGFSFDPVVLIQALTLGKL